LFERFCPLLQVMALVLALMACCDLAAALPA
jgi:hypothetical protein